MRKRDEHKQRAITEAVLEIVQEQGLNQLSMAKIAKAAGVSPATMYIYYADKTDMLSQIYLGVKRLMDDGLEEKLNKSGSYIGKFQTLLWHFASKFRDYPLETAFMFTVQSSLAVITDDALKESETMAKPISELFEEGVQGGYLRYPNPDLVVAMSFAPLSSLIQARTLKSEVASDEEIQQLIEMATKAILRVD